MKYSDIFESPSFKTVLQFGKVSYMALNMVNRGFVEWQSFCF